ncbi:MAG TPA: hypothetical protein VHD84_00635 [Candidatus Saccharimonadales bacterium]|nr:hypothetical protein [Candidatus Saccharimonadales bacterium]
MKNFIADTAGAISIILALWAAIPYIFSIIKGRTRPHQLTWLVFSIMNGIVLVSQYLKGGRASVMISLVWFITSSIDFGLSLKYGLRGTSRWDGLLFGLSIVTIAAWVLTKNPSVAIWLTVAIDVLATTMMVLKIKARPNSEASGPWIIATVAYIFTIVSVINKPLGILYVRPVYGFLSDIVVLAAIMLTAKSLKKSKEDKTSPSMI